jgi:hypothetical protein
MGLQERQDGLALARPCDQKCTHTHTHKRTRAHTHTHTHTRTEMAHLVGNAKEEQMVLALWDVISQMKTHAHAYTHTHTHIHKCLTW